MSIYTRNILQFIIILALQVFLLNKIGLQWWGTPISGAPSFIPLLYPLFILLLPVNTPVWVMLFAGFFTGLTMDAFSNTGGMHAAATLIMAYARRPVLSILLPNKLDDFKQMVPTPYNLNWSTFLFYTAVLLFIHHLFYFMFEVWSFRSIGYTLLKTFITLITSMLFVLIWGMLFTKRR